MLRLVVASGKDVVIRNSSVILLSDPGNIRATEVRITRFGAEKGHRNLLNKKATFSH
jgi:hypothetical protein